MKKLMFYILLLSVSMFTTVHAEEKSSLTKSVAEVNKILQAAKKSSRIVKIREDQIAKISKKLEKLIKHIQKLEEKITAEVKSVTADMLALGEEKKNDPWSVKNKRQRLKDKKTGLDKFSAQLKLHLVDINDLKKAIVTRLTKVQAERLFARSEPFHRLLGNLSDQKVGIYKQLTGFITTKINFSKVKQVYFYSSLFFLLSVYLLFFFLRKLILSSSLLHRESALIVDRSSRLLIKNIITYLPGMSLAAAVFLLLDATDFDGELLLISRLSLVMFFVLLVLPFFLTLVSLVNIKEGADKVVHEQYHSMRRGLKILIYVTGVGYFLNSVFRQSGLEIHVLYILYDLILLLGLGLIYISVSRYTKLIEFHYASASRIMAAVMLFVVVIIAFSGYRNLSFYLVEAVVGLVVLGIVYWMLSNMLSFVNSGAVRRAAKFKVSPEVKVVKTIRFWLQVLLRIALMLGLVYATLHLLGFHETVAKQVDAWILVGFAVGSITIVPLKILQAILVFASLHSLTGWFRARLDSKWLKESGIERSAKEALVTMSGYIGIIIATLMALAIVGVSFTNLAIIAGALSVGIGFGLQNIVNNFISGLILLFERPIKTGDWIVVGNIEGYVKRISIRSTIIQTFERADVIVPNAELITTKVTNWMYRDRRGRVNVPVGVAYGSNVEQVIGLLTAVAENHEQVIKGNAMYPVRVLMLSFGDSALQFELRCFIDDIDLRVTVLSELNISVETTLREAGIEIPFPQRDVHVIEENRSAKPE